MNSLNLNVYIKIAETHISGIKYVWICEILKKLQDKIMDKKYKKGGLIQVLFIKTKIADIDSIMLLWLKIFSKLFLMNNVLYKWPKLSNPKG
jgi:hypothetical protein